MATETTECRHGLADGTCSICSGRDAAERRANRDVLGPEYGRKDCEACGAEMAFARYPSGAVVPLDPAPSPQGNVIVDGGGHAHVGKHREIEDHTGPLYVSHFATCIDPRRFRR